MLRYVYPNKLKILTSGRHLSVKFALWLLDVAGPFCLWPPPKDRVYSHADRMASSLSNLLRAPVFWHIDSGPKNRQKSAINLLVTVTEEMETLLREQVYEAYTKRGGRH